MSTPDAPPEPAVTRSPRAGERLLGELLSEIARADSKASTLVAALSTTAGVFSGLPAGRDWHPTALSGAGSVPWWTGAAALAEHP
ncbi:hypothetical protein [Streptomyces sp. NPDC056105]|uniref:hypothetical protein n=1 Tax=Streptomyces sp. NPDC056105 TaxID=3345714 RepID=UPI0035E33A18